MPRDTNDQQPRPRREVPPIKVWVTDAERDEIAELADQAGLSLSAYLLAAGLKNPIRSKLDFQAVRDFAKFNGDLEQVAGLLKIWLAEKRGQGARTVDVEALMLDFRKLQSAMMFLMSRMYK